MGYFPEDGTYVRHASGFWYTANYVARSTGTVANGELRLAPFLVTKTTTFSAMRIGVTSGGTSGSVHRLGIYDTAADGTPGSLILDAGTVATTTTGDKEITGLSAQLTPGLYWLTAVQQGAPSTPATIRTLTESDYGPSSAASNAAGGWYEAGATGALPATYTGDTVGGVVPLVSIKAA